MKPAKYNINIPQGTNYSLTFTLKVGGNPRDLTGYSARGQIRSSHSSDTILATFDCSIPTPSNGQITIALDNATTGGIAKSTNVYDIEIFTAGDANVERVLEGKATIDPQVTR